MSAPRLRTSAIVRLRAVAIAAVALAGLALPLVWSHPFVLHVAIQALIWALFAASWDVLSGYTGQISFGHGGLFAIGAYTAACLTRLVGVSSWIGMLAALLLCALVGLGVGFPALRLRGHYLALVTLGFGEIVTLVVTNWQSLTGGAFGMHDYGTFAGLPTEAIAQKQVAYVIVAAVSLTGLAVLLYLTRRTGAGPAFRAIREDQILAASLGIDTTYYKLLAFSLSAGLAGLAGSLYAYYIQLVSPTVGSSASSALVIGMAVFGGIGTIWGPFLGAILLFGITEGLRFIGVVYNLIAVGAVMVVFVIFVPRGLAGIRLYRRGRQQRADRVAADAEG
jgi:branched-chain amino acid transport system permease protein